MKRFKEFIKKKVVEPILITAQPVHGSHARSRKQEEKLEEAINWLGKKYNQPESVNRSKWIKHNENSHIAQDPITYRHRELIADKLKEAHPNLTSDHPSYGAVKDYTRTSHKINQYHLDNAEGIDTSNDSRLPEYKKQTEHLDAILKEHKLPYNIHLYHGAGFNPGKEAAKHPEGLIRMPSYLSTSHNKVVAKSFAGGSIVDNAEHILHIHAKKGQHGLYIGNRVIGDEHETLLPRNQVLKVHPKPTILSDGTRIWHSTIHSQD